MELRGKMLCYSIAETMHSMQQARIEGTIDDCAQHGQMSVQGRDIAATFTPQCVCEIVVTNQIWRPAHQCFEQHETGAGQGSAAGQRVRRRA